MRIAALADVHGNLPALEAVLSHLETEGGPEEIWVLGDLAVFCPYPMQVLERLSDLPKARCLQGNTDRYLVTGRDGDLHRSLLRMRPSGGECRPFWSSARPASAGLFSS